MPSVLAVRMQASIRAVERRRHRPAGREHRPEARSEQRRAEHVLGLVAGRQLRRAQRVLQALLRIRRQARERGRVELARVGPLRLRPRLAALRQREDRHRRRQRERDHASRRRLPAGAGACASASWRSRSSRRSRPPGQHRVGEHVVEDLVARPAAVLAVHLAQDPLVPERLEHRPELGLVDRRVLGEIGRAVRDLRPRRRDEAVEDARGDVLLRRPEPGERALEMLTDDRLGAAERHAASAAGACREPSSRSASHRRSSTSWRNGASMRASRVAPSAWPRPPSTSSSRPVATSSSTASTSSGSASDVLAGRPARRRAAGRRPPPGRSHGRDGRAGASSRRGSAIRPLNASSTASVSSRRERRTLTRSPRSPSSDGELRAEAGRRRRGRGSTPRTGRGSRTRTRPRCRRRAARSSSVRSSIQELKSATAPGLRILAQAPRDAGVRAASSSPRRSARRAASAGSRSCSRSRGRARARGRRRAWRRAPSPRTRRGPCTGSRGCSHPRLRSAEPRGPAPPRTPRAAARARRRRAGARTRARAAAASGCTAHER